MKTHAILLGAVLLGLMPVLSYAQAPITAHISNSSISGQQKQLHLTFADPLAPMESQIINQLAELTASNGYAGDNLGGWGVAIDGDTAVAGGLAGGGNGTGSGIGYVFVEPSSGWGNMTQTAKLTTSDGSPIGSVGISGNTIVGAGTSGVAYVFVEPATGWADMTETARLTASNGDSLMPVAIGGNTVVAAAGSGAAYVFVEPATGWTDMTETAKLTTSTGDYLTGVAIDGNTVVAGSVRGNSGKGAAYVFVEPAGGWASMTQTAELTASDGASPDYLGCGVGISGDTVVAGAPNHATDGNSWRGAAYVFVKPAGGWTNMTQTAKLTASDGAHNDQLGNSADIDGDTVVAGAPQYFPRTTGSGKAYAFFKPAGGWTNMTESMRLEATDGVLCDAIGVSVAVNNGTAVAGAPGICEDGTSGKPGAAYVFATCTSDSGARACPGALTFGTQLVGTSSNPQAVTLINSGNSPLKIWRIITSNANFSQTNNCPSKLPVNGQCTINVTFDPQRINTIKGKLTIKDNAPNSPQTVPLSGVGTEVTLLPSNLNFGDEKVNTTSPPQVATLTNYGTQAVTVYAILISGRDSADFAETNNCGTGVPPGGNCTINVTFTPLSKGSKTATLKVKDNGGASPQTVALSGTGT